MTLLGWFRYVSNNPSIKKAIQNYKNDIAQIGVDYQNKLLVVETEIQDLKNEFNDIIEIISLLIYSRIS